MKIAVSQAELGLLISALYDKSIETKRYVSGYDAPDVPEERHTCCDFHRLRYERDREQSAALKERLKAEKALIKRLEKREER